MRCRTRLNLTSSMNGFSQPYTLHERPQVPEDPRRGVAPPWIPQGGRPDRASRRPPGAAAARSRAVRRRRPAGASRQALGALGAIRCSSAGSAAGASRIRTTRTRVNVSSDRLPRPPPARPRSTRRRLELSSPVDSLSLRPGPSRRRALSAARRATRPGVARPRPPLAQPLSLLAPLAPGRRPPLLCAQLFYRHAGLPYDARWREFALARDREVRASARGGGSGGRRLLHATCIGRRSADPSGADLPRVGGLPRCPPPCLPHDSPRDRLPRDSPRDRRPGRPRRRWQRASARPAACRRPGSRTRFCTTTRAAGASLPRPKPKPLSHTATSPVSLRGTIG